MQMFIRDPAGNLLEISFPKSADEVDTAILQDELVDSADTFVFGRADGRGARGKNATLYGGRSDD